MPNWLKQRSELTPNRTALKTKDETITFQQLFKRVQVRASNLSQLGVKQGQHVGILMRNSVAMVETIHALMSIGAVTVLLNHRLSKSELNWQIVDVEATYIIVDDEFSDNVADFHLIINEQLSAMKAASLSNAVPRHFNLDDVATIMYTSGTTGNPKGVLQTYGNHWSSAIGSVLNLGLQTEDRWLLAVPLFHISGLSILMRSVIYGIGIHLHERFDAKIVHQAIMDEGVAIISVVTTMLKQLLEELGETTYPPSFRCMLVGGGPVPKKYLIQCKEKGIPVYQSYGMTETASQVVTLTPDDSLLKLGSAGKPLFSSELKIINNGIECQPNEEGEIVVKGPTITKGYWKREEATKAAFTDGWLHTGDQGYLDAEGFLYVLDRRSDLIISGGENVYPAEIESVLLNYKGVKEAGVIGIDDEKWGQSPHAFIVTAEEISPVDLLDFCRSKLARYKVPKSFTFVDKLPRNASNKLLRRELKKIIKEQSNDKD
ncbi:o-succinylbenzoate--CoA ligase [Metabacillus malikii]|nr:o-succinylbenzoate--CoA ligase [Metabacillus malikii]